ncbi:hypothetical protein [Euzebyella saccharophila]|uniref:Uncharacterized protein n=1 Tax=Euzebyella saccharophila TaxID=679664 RepID=A0ABV8JWU5_9FLAO|nr:hypothetical protein [Euzebyella saccharophila]
MDKTLRILLMLAVIGVGMILGGILGFFGLFWVCEYLDAQDAERAASGGGYVAVGWIFLFVTIPFGALLGGVSGFFGFRWVSPKSKK